MEQEKEKLLSLQEKLDSGKEYYEIRLESIGGLGANLCAKMLGELGLKYLDLNSTNFSSYGSEKTGTPVKGFIRYCKNEKEIRVHYPVTEPDLLVVFHQALLQDASIWKGCSKETAIIIALEPGQEIKDVLAHRKSNGKKGEQKSFCHMGMIYGLEAQRIAMETHSRINVVMLGAILKIMGLPDIKTGELIMEDTLGKKYPDALQANLAGMKKGYEEVRFFDISTCEGTNVDIDISEEQEWGYDNAPIGGINTRFGNSVISDLSPSRQGYIPIFIKEKCINCGLCFSTCPDMVFQFAKGEYKGKEMMVNMGLDYYHCKGCLRCVDVCPVQALEKGVEAKHQNKEYFLPNQELIRTPDYYEESGPNGYITSESYLTEKRMEGGEV